ncbi:MAG: hypothetical protein CL466_10760 [Acidimicrobiaceae bacterium]|nr:hypothetical protein [Acidimicrobiaceae bacterium]
MEVQALGGIPGGPVADQVGSAGREPDGLDGRPISDRSPSSRRTATRSRPKASMRLSGRDPLASTSSTGSARSTMSSSRPTR